MFDDDDDGHLSVSELTEVVTGLGERLTITELSSMINQAGRAASYDNSEYRLCFC
jgi:Ca2+-binding EF-hand superfamily protein